MFTTFTEKTFSLGELKLLFKKYIRFVKKKKKDWLQKGFPQYFLLLSFERRGENADLGSFCR